MNFQTLQVSHQKNTLSVIFRLTKCAITALHSFSTMKEMCPNCSKSFTRIRQHWAYNPICMSFVAEQEHHQSEDELQEQQEEAICLENTNSRSFQDQGRSSDAKESPPQPEKLLGMCVIINNDTPTVGNNVAALGSAWSSSAIFQISDDATTRKNTTGYHGRSGDSMTTTTRYST